MGGDFEMENSGVATPLEEGRGSKVEFLLAFNKHDLRDEREKRVLPTCPPAQGRLMLTTGGPPVRA